MPELPEVQTVVDELLRAGIAGARIRAVDVLWRRSVAEPAANKFRASLAGRTIAACSRRGKFIVIDLAGGGHVLIHLRMTGRLILAAAEARREKHDRVVFRLAGGRELRLHDTRKFARVRLVADAAAALGALGPEPLAEDFTAECLRSRLARHRRMLKPLLLDQTFLAGLGNIYVDEALWEARLHPRAEAAALAAVQAAALHRAIRTVLVRGLRNRGTSLGRGKGNCVSPERRRGRNRAALAVFRRTGEPCPRCGAAIERRIVGQRATHVCPRCQNERGGPARGPGKAARG